jgi:tartrate-resistant acid phosphatase type 5
VITKPGDVKPGRLRFYLVLITVWLAICLGCKAATLNSSPPTEPTAIAVTQPQGMPAAPTEFPTATELPAPSSTLAPPTDTPLPPSSPTPTPVRFAVIGDYGLAGPAEKDVADLVKSWNPDFIITVGDNNYPSGAAETIDQNIGQYYQEFIFPYQGAYGPGATQNRFFPTLGNHDWDTARARPYLDYFELPGNERYYDYTWGPLHLFAISSDSREPDGVGMSSPQAAWLKERLDASTEPWKIVYFHQPPYSSGTHGSVDWMRWPFKKWGATAVLAGHDHTYERLSIGGIPYFVDGVGGGPIYSFLLVLEGSQVRYNDDYGAMLITADSSHITFQFFNRQRTLIDEYTITRENP